MIDPGSLKTRLVLQQPVEAPDGQGGVTLTWTAYATVWAQVTPLRARGAVEAEVTANTQSYRIVMRGNFSVTTAHRLVEGSRIYRIEAIRERDDRRFIEIDAELRAG